MFSLVMKILDVPPPLYHSTQVKRYSSDVFTRNCNWKNEKVFVIIYSILVALFSVIKGNMYVYVRHTRNVEQNQCFQQVSHLFVLV